MENARTGLFSVVQANLDMASPDFDDMERAPGILCPQVSCFAARLDERHTMCRLSAEGDGS